MEREQFNIQHFLACHFMQWEGSPGLKTQKTLEGVGYYLQMPEGIEGSPADLMQAGRLLT